MFHLEQQRLERRIFPAARALFFAALGGYRAAWLNFRRSRLPGSVVEFLAGLVANGSSFCHFFFQEKVGN